MCKSKNARCEVARHLVNLEAKEILDLRAGNNDGDPIRETHDHRAGYELNRSTQTGCAQDQQDDSSQQGAHEQAIDTEFRDNSEYHHHEGASWTAYLGWGPSESRN